MNSYNWLSAVYDLAIFIAFDTETTGLKVGQDRVIEIGAVKFDKKGIISRMNVLINPEMPIPEDATCIHKITNDMLKDAPVMKNVIMDFLEFIKDGIFVIHNAKFDIGMMNHELALLGGSELTNTVVDTLTFAKEIYPGLQSYSLQNLADLFNIDVLNAHRAEDDARVCMDFFNLSVKHFFEENAGQLENFIKATDVKKYIYSKTPTFTEVSKEQSLF